jgi:hypothetical protein
MIVTASAIAVAMCPMASHQPAKTIQTMLPIREGAPASDRLTSRLPNGQSANSAIRNEASVV